MAAFRSLALLALGLALAPRPALAQTPGAYQRVAVATHRISRDHMEIQVMQGKKVLGLPRFQEILVVTPAGPAHSLQDLAAQRVLVVPSEKHPHEWDVFSDAARPRGVIRPAAFVRPLDRLPLSLADNVFTVRRVLISRSRQPLTVKAGSKLYAVKAGQALLVLN